MNKTSFVLIYDYYWYGKGGIYKNFRGVTFVIIYLSMHIKFVIQKVINGPWNANIVPWRHSVANFRILVRILCVDWAVFNFRFKKLIRFPLLKKVFCAVNIPAFLPKSFLALRRQCTFKINPCYNEQAAWVHPSCTRVDNCLSWGREV